MKRSRIETACRIALGGSILSLSFWATVAFGQTTAATNSEDLEDVVVTGTRAVTATKTDTPILNIPQSINIVSAAQIEDRGANSIIEALNYTAGVSNGGDDSRGDFNVVRGFESVLFVDGLKRNYGFVYLPRADVNALERVEVLVGPASVLYGPGSASGLTNMISKRPRFTSGGSASLSYGSFERKEAVVDYTGPISDSLAFRMVGLVRDANSQIDFVPNDRVLVQPALTWKPSESTEITALALYQKDKNGPNYNVVPLPASILAAPGRRLPDSVFLGEPGFQDKGFKDNKSLTLLVNHEFSDMFAIHSSTRGSKASTDQREVYPWVFSNPLNPFIDEDGDGIIQDDETSVTRNIFAFDVDYKTFNTDNNAELNFDTGGFSHKVLVGLDYSYFRQNARQAFGESTPIDIYNPVYGNAPPAVYADPTVQIVKQTGYYAQDQVDFGKVASLVIGLRRDKYKKEETSGDEKANKTTKRAGLTIKATPTLSPYVSYAESFQPIAGLNQFGGSYSPLTAEQKEVGVKWQPLQATLLRVSYYDIKENNSLQTDPDNPLNSIQSGTTKSKGFEFQADHNITKDLTITASYSHAKTNVSDNLGDYGPQRDNFPKELANFFTTKTMAINDDLTLRYGGGVRYVGPQVSGNLDIPSYTLVDAMATLDYKSWTLRFNALNLFDERYYPTCYVYGFCANGLKRTMEATVAYRFN